MGGLSQDPLTPASQGKPLIQAFPAFHVDRNSFITGAREQPPLLYLPGHCQSADQLGVFLPGGAAF